MSYALGASFAILPFFLVWICDTASYAVQAEIAADSPSGIFFTSRASRIGL